MSAAVRLRSGSYGTYALAAQPNSDSWAPERNQLPVRIGPDNQVATWPWVVPARSARTVTGTWHQALRGVVRLRLDGDDFSIHGTITNELPVALRRPVLLWAHGGWALDNIAAGATLQVRAASAPADLQLDLHLPHHPEIGRAHV